MFCNIVRKGIPFAIRNQEENEHNTLVCEGRGLIPKQQKLIEYDNKDIE